LKHLIDRLRKMPLKQRREVPGLNPDRADIFVPGLAVIDGIMSRFKVNLLQVHSAGVRDGLLLTMIERLQGASEATPPDEIAQIERFASACGVELDHARQTASLSSQIYKGLCESYELNPDDVRLLDAAARMQDVGYLINYKRHHKHSYHLILHSAIEGFRPEDLEIIANVARYHRGAMPKNKHENFSRLSKGDQRRVLTMAAVLRLAGGLDRSHNQTIRTVNVNATGEQVEITISANDCSEVDLWAARRRAEFFERAFDAELTIRWGGQAPATDESCR
jgi:exopolyphosphatase/guanosine-5'-triphosphate,3'-diphosphate pyrophosphatase